MTSSPPTTDAQAPSLSTLTFKCTTTDEAFRIIAALQPQGYWAHLICLTSGEVTLHLRPFADTTQDQDL
jgi:hypothetical protein